ncbi:MAG: hypothetical protein ACXAC7_15725 [Candidatus Hodarchaeales archaeon]
MNPLNVHHKEGRKICIIFGCVAQKFLPWGNEIFSVHNGYCIRILILSYTNATI